MRALLLKLVATIGSFVASARLLWSLKDPVTPISTWQIGAIVLILVLTAFLVYTDIQDYLNSRIRVLKSERKIRDYMFDLVSKGNRVCIFTRDMSWVHDDEMKEMLSRKAKAESLSLVMPAPTKLSMSLQSDGATVHYYGTETPPTKSRFTITNVDRADVRITIGRAENSKRHKVETFTEEHGNPAYSLAQDLASLLRAIDSSTPVSVKMQPNADPNVKKASQ